MARAAVHSSVDAAAGGSSSPPSAAEALPSAAAAAAARSVLTRLSSSWSFFSLPSSRLFTRKSTSHNSVQTPHNANQYLGSFAAFCAFFQIDFAVFFQPFFGAFEDDAFVSFLEVSPSFLSLPLSPFLPSPSFFPFLLPLPFLSSSFSMSWAHRSSISSHVVIWCLDFALDFVRRLQRSSGLFFARIAVERPTEAADQVLASGANAAKSSKETEYRFRTLE
mmetsp:Transcript_47242/g.101118  ORF Transcript_47242/g.101118 Transcript_47242/m.101118 type:complete len:221 (-) Transcript_47242:5-667(-)